MQNKYSRMFQQMGHYSSVTFYMLHRVNIKNGDIGEMLLCVRAVVQVQTIENCPE